MSIADSLTNLDAKRDALAANLVTKGVAASNTEHLAALVAKVLDIVTGTPEVNAIIIGYAGIQSVNPELMKGTVTT